MPVHSKHADIWQNVTKKALIWYFNIRHSHTESFPKFNGHPKSVNKLNLNEPATSTILLEFQVHALSMRTELTWNHSSTDFSGLFNLSNTTRMHSSRMHTARSLTLWVGGYFCVRFRKQIKYITQTPYIHIVSCIENISYIEIVVDLKFSLVLAHVSL